MCKAMKFEKIEKELQKQISPKRYRHTVGVAYTAASMAMAQGYDVSKAYLAGLLHDNAKGIDNDKKIRLCKKYGLSVSKTEEQNPELLHAKLGSYLAKKDFRIEDKDILNAIEFHTTGRKNMSLLEKILFVADYIEPNRKQIPNLEEVRYQAFHNLDKAVFLELEGTLAFLKDKAAVMDQTTYETYEYYKKELKK